jgi:hypothetical protein
MSVLESLPLAEREQLISRLEDEIKRTVTEGGRSLSQRALLDQVARTMGCTPEDVAYALSRLGALTDVG